MVGEVPGALGNLAQAVLGEEAFAAAWKEGRAMSLEQAVEYALETDIGASDQNAREGLTEAGEIVHTDNNPHPFLDTSSGR